MRPRIYTTIDVSSCNAVTAATTAVTVIGPLGIQEYPDYDVCLINDAGAGSAATSTITYTAAILGGGRLRSI